MKIKKFMYKKIKNNKTKLKRTMIVLLIIYKFFVIKSS